MDNSGIWIIGFQKTHEANKRQLVESDLDFLLEKNVFRLEVTKIYFRQHFNNFGKRISCCLVLNIFTWLISLLLNKKI